MCTFYSMPDNLQVITDYGMLLNNDNRMTMWRCATFALISSKIMLSSYLVCFHVGYDNDSNNSTKMFVKLKLI